MSQACDLLFRVDRRKLTGKSRREERRIFHDCWLERPSTVPSHLKPEDVKEANVILINHAHFDHGLSFRISGRSLYAAF